MTSTVIVDLHLLLRDGSKVLLGLRQNTGFGDGMFHLPAGHLEEGETLLQGMVREAKEELGTAVAERDLTLVHVCHHNTERVAFFFEATQWAGDATNCEPAKCAELRWFPADRLWDNLVPYARDALVSIGDGIPFASSGWGL